MTSSMPGCPFCDLIATRQDLLADDAACVAFFDAFPLSPGHVLVVPRRHEPDFLALAPHECSAILRMAFDLRAVLESRFHPHGFNLGVNVGAAAGQTVGHAHLHLIPRYRGDVADPRGGIRWMIPERAPYWKDSIGAGEG